MSQLRSLGNYRVLLKARRLMVIGLVISVLGNRVIEGGFDAMTAAGVVAVPLLVAVKSLGELCVFAFPAYARFLKNRSPDRALIVVDLAEAGLSAIALIVAMVRPDLAIVAVVVYVLIDLFLAPVTDIADEFYGAKFAQIDEKHALAFNATLWAMLGFLGLVVASPAGAVLSGLSTPLLLLVNIVLSLFGAGFRMVARRSSPMGPLAEVDSSEFSVMGQRIPFKQFINEMLRSGPASPLLSLIIGVAGTLTGELLLLWAAGRDGLDAHSAMAIVLATFGIGATIGPMIGRLLRTHWDTGVVLRGTALASFVNVAALLVQVMTWRAGFVAALVFILINATLSRARIIVLETHRQAFFQGSQFARVMSWSYSFGALGTLLGLQVGYWLGLVNDPTIPLIITAILWIVIAVFINSSRGHLEPVGGTSETPRPR